MIPRDARADSVRFDLAVVAAFTLLLALPFLGSAFDIDEPYFLAVARHILADPWHPLDFRFNWFGKAVPASDINVHPMVLPYVLAPFLHLSGGREWLMRLFCLPFDLMAALSLYLLAARTLAKPLIPTLLVLAGPAYALNMHHLMGEKWIGAFGFASMAALLSAIEDDRAAWLWGSAALLALALMSKFTAIFLLAPALVLLIQRRVPLRRVASYAALALAPLGVMFVVGHAGTLMHARSLKEGMLGAGAYSWLGTIDRLRATAAFCGGCVCLPLLPALRESVRGRGIAQAAGLAAVAALFLPAFDTSRVIALDRAFGIVCALSAVWTWLRLSSEPYRCSSLGNFWLAWLACVIAVQLTLYWSAVTRFTLFMAPPIVFLSAEFLESRRGGGAILRPILAATVGLTLLLGLVDAKHAAAERDVALRVVRSAAKPGRTLWFTGHWSLQYYMEQAGGRAIDVSEGGWDRVKPGDVVVVPMVNTNVVPPGRRLLADVDTYSVGHPVPLRLTAYGDRQAGFYSSVFGFLPFTIGLEPVDELSVVTLK
ncbi:MAG: glycosyltransferase family 39 protein [Elusimicrobia bacterium]|nr:glycosyltransferase family 39 protein [Elusimicrobiota bacterium]